MKETATETQLIHHSPQGISDPIAFFTVRFMRFFADQLKSGAHK